MFAEKLFRVVGLVGMLAGTFWALYEIGEVVGLVPLTSDAALDLIAHGLIVFVVIGLYARQAAQAGWFGAVAFVIYLTGLMVNQGMKAIYTLVAPTLATQYPAAAQAVGTQSGWGLFTLVWTTLTFLGPVLFGIATLRARVLPRWAAILLVVGPIFSMTGLLPLPGNPGAVLTALGFVGLSYGAWSIKSATFTHSQPTMEAVTS
jgi:hypothetical protein